MLNRLGEFIVDGGWPVLWEFTRVPLIGLVVYLIAIAIASLIGKGVA